MSPDNALSSDVPRGARPAGERGRWASMMSTLRWLLLVPAAIAVWYCVFVLGAFTYSFVEKHLCPPEDLISGLCTNSTIKLWLTIVAHAFVALSALAVMIVAVVISPRGRKPMAWLTLVVGTAVAAYLGAMTHEWTLFAAAVAGGFAGFAVIVYWLHRRPDRLAHLVKH
ncbi:MAG TPA: hypothetical protein VF789_31980 [Thermoanaerobaculia bacterium]